MKLNFQRILDNSLYKNLISKKTSWVHWLHFQLFAKFRVRTVGIELWEEGELK